MFAFEKTLAVGLLPLALLGLTNTTTRALASEASAVTSSVSVGCYSPAKGKKFPDGNLAGVALFPDGFTLKQLACFFNAKNQQSKAANDGQKAIKFTADLTVTDVFGNPIQTLRRSGKTNRDGRTAVIFDGPFPAGSGALVYDIDIGGGKKLDRATADCIASSVPRCVQSDTTMCLIDNRFAIEAGGPGGPLMVLDVDGDSGTFTENGVDPAFEVTLLGCRDGDGNSTDDLRAVLEPARDFRNPDVDLLVLDTVAGTRRLFSLPTHMVGPRHIRFGSKACF